VSVVLLLSLLLLVFVVAVVVGGVAVVVVVVVVVVDSVAVGVMLLIVGVVVEVGGGVGVIIIVVGVGVVKQFEQRVIIIQSVPVLLSSLSVASLPSSPSATIIDMCMLWHWLTRDHGCA